MLHIVWIWFHDDRNQINQSPNAKQSEGKKVKDPHPNFSFIELMYSKITKKQTEKECDPFVFCLSAVGNRSAVINIGVIAVCLLINSWVVSTLWLL